MEFIDNNLGEITKLYARYRAIAPFTYQALKTKQALERKNVNPEPEERHILKYPGVDAATREVSDLQKALGKQTDPKAKEAGEAKLEKAKDELRRLREEAKKSPEVTRFSDPGKRARQQREKHYHKLVSALKGLGLEQGDLNPNNFTTENQAA